MRIKLLKVH